ncbi:M15 family metallopeptidase [Winogradskyella sp.]|uniref:M15 family metallopeptidase n=1 Tax=Winogradskyella sp. TaxID=1883156 RepID=UPI00262D4123|nr:M15 family metallopeptidase [Winogradskyella sp.]
MALILFLGCSIISCHTKTKDTNGIEIKEPAKDTLKTIKKDTLNISKAFVLGKFDYKSDSTFVKVSSNYSSKNIYLKNEVYQAFLQMCNAANKDSVTFKIISGTRNFNEQKSIWERKWVRYKDLNPKDRALKILEYSSMPSSSRHHWGTDIDLNSLNNSYFNSGKGLLEYQWLTIHANRFGFYQVYTDKTDGRTGYQLEKWHWSYLPLANQYLAFYNANVNAGDIKGFKGSELAAQLRIIEDYVNGISKKAINYN